MARDLEPGTRDYAHDKLAAMTRGHSQTHTMFICEKESMYAISCAEGQRVFSLYEVCVEDPDHTEEIHLSPEAARVIAAFITEWDPGSGGVIRD